jgi:hypothetical protein
MLEPSDLYHMGFVVPDLEAGMDEMGRAAGLRWASMQDTTLPLVGPDGPFDLHIRFTYSIDFPHIELIESIPGSLWEGAPGHAAHHLGYWTDDVAAASKRLETELGAPRLVTYATASGEPKGFAYHRLPSGMLIEVVDRARAAQFAEWFAGGEWAPAR